MCYRLMLFANLRHIETEFDSGIAATGLEIFGDRSDRTPMGIEHHHEATRIGGKGSL